MSDPRPIGVFDSGVGGLTVLREIVRRTPHESTIYLGDNETDEDAFRALLGRGVGIRVMESPAETAATWSLHDPAEATAFLGRLADWLAEG